MTSGPVRKFGVMYDHTLMFVNHQSDMKSQLKWTVSLVMADDHFKLPQGFVWVCVSQHTCFITTESRL